MSGITEVGKPMGAKGKGGGGEKSQGGGSCIQPACSQHTRCSSSLPPPCSLPRNVPPPPLAHIPFLCFLPQAETSSDLAEKNLTDAFRQQGPERYFCLVQGIPTDPGVWY